MLSEKSKLMMVTWFDVSNLRKVRKGKVTMCHLFSVILYINKLANKWKYHLSIFKVAFYRTINTWKLQKKENSYWTTWYYCLKVQNFNIILHSLTLDFKTNLNFIFQFYQSKKWDKYQKPLMCSILLDIKFFISTSIEIALYC